MRNSKIRLLIIGIIGVYSLIAVNASAISTPKTIPPELVKKAIQQTIQNTDCTDEEDCSMSIKSVSEQPLSAAVEVQLDDNYIWPTHHARGVAKSFIRNLCQLMNGEIRGWPRTEVAKLNESQQFSTGISGSLLGGGVLPHFYNYSYDELDFIVKVKSTCLPRQ